MFTSQRIYLSVSLASILSFSTISYASSANINRTYYSPRVWAGCPCYSVNRTNVYAELLYIKPYSDNLKYATFVAGDQPYSQSWHYQAINPNYHPAFEVGFNYAISPCPYSIAGNWVHLNSNDSSSKQANTSIDTATIEFVGPPYEMSPPVFGIKHVDSNVNFAFDRVELNAVKWIDFGSDLHAQFFGGLNFLRLNQTVKTTFSDLAGALPTPYSYALPPDPSFSFETKNVSEYLGAGPDLGVNLQYMIGCGFGVMGELTGLLTAGTIKANDYFTSTSARLTEIGIGTSNQEITSPSATQVVFGVDSKIGVFYNFHGCNLPDVTVEAGYRIAAYHNAISTVSPNTLVQPGTVVTTPEFSTGTMAIVSTNAVSRPFNFNGLFLNIKVAIC